MAMDQAFVDRMIQNQHSAIRYHFIFLFAVVGGGLVLLIFGHLFAPDAAKVAVQTGGGIVAGIGSVFPIKELTARKEKLGIFEEIKIQLQTFNSNEQALDEPERKRMSDLLWQAIQKTID
jgi:hypothetical protein